MTEEMARTIGEVIWNSTFMKRYGEKTSHFVEGTCEIFPLTIHLIDQEYIIQLDPFVPSNNRSRDFKKLVKKIKSIAGDEFIRGYFFDLPRDGWNKAIIEYRLEKSDNPFNDIYREQH